MGILLIGQRWGNQEPASLTFWFQQVWGLLACGQHTVNFFHLVGFQYLQNSSKDMAQNIICSPWGRPKVPWLCLMVKALLFCLTWLFSFCIFSLLWLNVFFDYSFSTDKRQAEDVVVGGSILGRPHRILLVTPWEQHLKIMKLGDSQWTIQSDYLLLKTQSICTQSGLNQLFTLSLINISRK